MKMILSLILISSFLNAESESINLSLKKAINLSLTNSEDIKIRYHKIENAESKYYEALSSALPNIKSSVTLNNYLKAPVLRADIGMGLMEIPIKQPWETIGEIAFTQTLFTFGKIRNSLKAAKNTKKIEQRSMNATRSEIIFQTKYLYYLALSAKKNLDITKSSYKNALKNQKILKTKLKTGRASKFDNVKMATDVSSRVPNVKLAEKEVKIAMQQLKAMTGIKDNLKINLTSSMSKNFKKQDLEKLQDKLYKNEPSLKIYESSINLSKNISNLESAKYFPDLALFGTYQYYGEGNRTFIRQENMNHMFMLGIGLTWDLWNGGKTTSKHLQAKRNIDIAKLEYQKKKKDLILDLKATISSYNHYKKIYESNLKTLKLSNQYYKLSLQSYEAGKIRQSDLNDAELMLTKAKILTLKTLLQINIYKAKIKKLTSEKKI
jgi:outer membrane protein